MNDSATGMASRLDAITPSLVARSLDVEGACRLEGLLSAQECDELASNYGDDSRFRKTVVMARHGFGSGEYRYFRYPLPPVIAKLRRRLYPPLAEVANAWNERLGFEQRFPATHADFLDQCAENGQERPTPLILRYVKDDYNCLHQDLYGQVVFPLQLTIMLSSPGEDFSGGEFVLTEQRPRMQSRAQVVPLLKGDAVIFPVNIRPREGKRGYHQVRMRHGVSRVRSGERFAAGVIFHDAR